MNAVKATNLKKKFKGFTLDIPEFEVPSGVATALIGENGAGKTTLLNAMTGIRLDYDGEFTYFEKYHEKEREEGTVKELIGYTGPGNYYMPTWTVKQVEEVSDILFDSFDKEKFETWCRDLAIFPGQEIAYKKKVSELSDGTKMKLMISNVLARDTKLLVMDEPASPLDPLMRDRLCEIIRDYVEQGNGERSVFFSTHNISDMEHITDYAIIMEHGQVVEKGYVSDLKEKYIWVKGDSADAEKVKETMFTMSVSQSGFEGVCLASNLSKLDGLNVTKDTASLFQISVAVMKKFSYLNVR